MMCGHNIIDGVKVRRRLQMGGRLRKLYNFEGECYGCRREWVWARVVKGVGEVIPKW